MASGPAARYIVNEILTDFEEEEIYVHCTVDEFLFGGYYVPFMAELSAMKGETLLPNNTFGLYYGRNGSESLKYEIIAGNKDPANFGRVVSYNSESILGVFEEESKCDKVHGYDGSMMAPFLTTDKEFQLFVPGLCRNMKFTFEEKTNMGGVPAFRFTVPENYLADVQTNPDNLCFCANPGENGQNCYKSGVWDLSPCKGGKKIIPQKRSERLQFKKLILFIQFCRNTYGYVFSTFPFCR
jgi:hypothetical protein